MASPRPGAAGDDEGGILNVHFVSFCGPARSPAPPFRRGEFIRPRTAISDCGANDSPHGHGQARSRQDRTLAAADAGRRDAELLVVEGQLARTRCGSGACPTRAQRVADGDGAAAGVGARAVEAQLAFAAEVLGAEGFVDLDAADVGGARPALASTARIAGAGPMPMIGRHADGTAADDAGQRRQAVART